MQNYAEMSSRERKHEYSYFRIWPNDRIYQVTWKRKKKHSSLPYFYQLLMLLGHHIKFMLCLTRKNSQNESLNSQTLDAVCETSLVNCSLGSVKGERVILQVQCRGQRLCRGQISLKTGQLCLSLLSTHSKIRIMQFNQH